MTFPQLTLGIGAVLFGYVLFRYTTAAVRVDARGRRHAQNGLLFALVLPLLLFVTSPFEIPSADLRILVLGSALWVTLALALTAFSLTRVDERRHPARPVRSARPAHR